jgi:hypothetical protein
MTVGGLLGRAEGGGNDGDVITIGGVVVTELADLS